MSVANFAFPPHPAGPIAGRAQVSTWDDALVLFRSIVMFPVSLDIKYDGRS